MQNMEYGKITLFQLVSPCRARCLRPWRSSCERHGAVFGAVRLQRLHYLRVRGTRCVLHRACALGALPRALTPLPAVTFCGLGPGSLRRADSLSLTVAVVPSCGAQVPGTQQLAQPAQSLGARPLRSAVSLDHDCVPHDLWLACALAPMMLTNDSYVSRHSTVLSNDWKGLAMIAVMNGFQIACNNASLTVMELSMNQIIRASIPVLVAILAVCIESKVPSSKEIVCLIVISAGVMLAVWEESKNAMLGIVLTLVSTVMQSIQMSLSGKVMSGRSGKLDSFQMTFYTGPVAFVSLAPFAFATEWNVLAESISSKPFAVFGFLFGSCCVAVIYNVVLFQAVRTLSSVGTAILGNVKIVLLLFLSSALLGELGGWSANQYLGCLLTLSPPASTRT